MQPNYGRIHHELRRKGMTLILLLWEERRVDYAGLTIGLTNGSLAYIFVAALGASSYACAMPRERLISANMQPEFICLDLGQQALKYVDDAVPERPLIKAMALASTRRVSPLCANVRS